MNIDYLLTETCGDFDDGVEVWIGTLREFESSGNVTALGLGSELYMKKLLGYITRKPTKLFFWQQVAQGHYNPWVSYGNNGLLISCPQPSSFSK